MFLSCSLCPTSVGQKSEGLRILCALLAFFRASLTFNARPARLLPVIAAEALSASPALVISTKAKPGGRPVSLSVTILTRSTAPWVSKQGSQFLFSRAECEIANVKVLHSISSLCRAGRAMKFRRSP
jgi:hypothetical protein